MKSITYYRGFSETTIKNGSQCAKITKIGTYQRGCKGNYAGMAHTKA